MAKIETWYEASVLGSYWIHNKWERVAVWLGMGEWGPECSRTPKKLDNPPTRRTLSQWELTAPPKPWSNWGMGTGTPGISLTSTRRPYEYGR